MSSNLPFGPAVGLGAIDRGQELELLGEGGVASLQHVDPEVEAHRERADPRLECDADAPARVLGEGYTVSHSDGHTPGLMLTRIETPRGPLTFMGDLIPGSAWVHVPITMGYDRYPELVIEEKRSMLERLERERAWAFFTHDPEIAAARVTRDAKGRFTAVDAQPTLVWD